MNQHEGEPESATLVRRRRWDFVLLGLTVLCVAAYLPVLVVLPGVRDPLTVVLIAPTALMILAVGAALVWLWRGGATRRSRLVWAVFVSLGLIGAPTSCLSALIGTYEGSLIPR